MVAHEMHDTDVLVNLRVQCLQKGHEFSLTLPCITVPIALATTGARGGKEIEGTSALIFGLVSVGMFCGWVGFPTSIKFAHFLGRALLRNL